MIQLINNIETQLTNRLSELSTNGISCGKYLFKRGTKL